MRVAVVDSRIDRHHPDLEGQVALEEDFVDGHGDRPGGPRHRGRRHHRRAGRQRRGIVGVAPNARLLALRACWQQSSQSTGCTSLGLAMALHFAITHGAEVINLSLSGPSDRLLDRLLDVALARSISVVAAVDRSRPDGGFPASHAGVVAVADESGGAGLAGRAWCAPGRDVPTTAAGRPMEPGVGLVAMPLPMWRACSP